MKVIDVAKIYHEANRALCENQGDFSQADWENAPDWQKESVVKGVEFHLDNENAKPEDSHNSWLAVKRDEGWKYGTVKNPETKEHPCFVPYKELSKEQQSKDYLFKSVVDGLRSFIVRG